MIKHLKFTYDKTITLISIFTSVLLYRELYLCVTLPYEILMWAEIWKLSIIQFIVISVWSFLSRFANEKPVAGINFFYWFFISIFIQLLLTVILSYSGLLIIPHLNWEVLTKYPIYALYIPVLSIFIVHSFLNTFK